MDGKIGSFIYPIFYYLILSVKYRRGSEKKMGKGILKINSKGSTYISDELRNDGFVGDVPYYSTARIVTIVHPEATLEDALQSLDIIKQDLELRLKAEKREKRKKTRVSG